MKKAIYSVVGFITLLLGAVGAVLPILPTVPFLLVSGYCFAKSSKKINDWFVSTNLYKNNLESYLTTKTMTQTTKIRIMAIVTATMGLGFFMMSSVPVARVILFLVWVFHIIYFIFFIKTVPVEALNYKYCKNVKIDGMRCKDCAKSIECALNEQENIYATVSFSKEQAVILSKDKIIDSVISDTISQIGYKAKIPLN